MNGLQLFDNGEFRIQVSAAGDSFTVEAPGLAQALGFRDAYRLVESLPEDEKGYTTACTPGGEQRIWHVTEPGFYRAIGQRQVARIKDGAVRSMVSRFQNWVYRDVLPTIRRTGGYALQPVMAFQPVTYTWEEVAAELRQSFGLNYAPAELPRLTRAAGVLKQTGGPRREFEAMFWWTGTRWSVHPGALGVLAYKLTDVERRLRNRGFLQTTLNLTAVTPGPTQLRLGGDS